MKKSVVVLGLLMLCLLAVGCAFGSAGGATSAAVSSQAVSSQAPTAQPGSLPAPVSADAPAPQQSSQPAPSGISGSGNAPQPPPSSEARPTSAPAAESQTSIDGVEDKYLSGLGDIVGTVLEAHADGFTCEGGAPELSADGQVAAVATALKADVAYTDQTVFLLLEYTMATEESTVRMASADEVATGRGVAVWGGFENEKFVASVVRVFVPV